MSKRLTGAISPYLAQHATDPVQWWPWGEEAFAHARETDRLVLVSIGYSSCHWCHVMQAESFRDPELAAAMNARYVCIKVDREERPDVDHLYMDALQLMTGSGGWPLNCFALPDGRPVYAGTYFRPDRWQQLLVDLDGLWRNDRDRVMAQADALHDGLLKLSGPVSGDAPDLATWVAAAMAGADPEHGGFSGAPKFAMPAFQSFLLNEALITGNTAVRAHLQRTLDAMVAGALCDQADGGFARYTVDAAWQLPHFERMLYDNAQLISLYAEGFTAFNDPLYRRSAERAIAWVQDELGTGEGDHYAATDAVTTDGEGAYQAWTLAEIEALEPAQRATFDRWYTLSEPHAAIEDRRLLIHRELPRSAADLAACDALCADLHLQRAVRPAPKVDTKRLTAWNALMVSGLCKAGDRFQAEEHHAAAARTMQVLLAEHRMPNGGLWHDRRPHAEGIPGFLDDHAFTLRALLDLYASTGDNQWLATAQELERWIGIHFGSSDLLPFALPDGNSLVAPTIEVRDGVTPSSNALLADARYDLALLLQDNDLADKALRALDAALPRVAADPVGHGQWGRLLRKTQGPWYRISISGPDVAAQRRSLAAMGLPGILHSDSEKATGIQLCTLQACLAPFPDPEAVRAHCANPA